MIRPAVVLLFAITVPAVAQTPATGPANKDTAELVSLCRKNVRDSSGKNTDPVGALQCLRYVEGFKDGLVFAGGEPKFCAPGVTLGAQVEAFLRWADEHKGALDQTKQVTLTRFLSETYPCKK